MTTLAPEYKGSMWFTRGRLKKGLPKILGIEKLPILLSSSRKALDWGDNLSGGSVGLDGLSASPGRDLPQVTHILPLNLGVRVVTFFCTSLLTSCDSMMKSIWLASRRYLALGAVLIARRSLAACVAMMRARMDMTFFNSLEYCSSLRTVVTTVHTFGWRMAQVACDA